MSVPWYRSIISSMSAKCSKTNWARATLLRNRPMTQEGAGVLPGGASGSDSKIAIRLKASAKRLSRLALDSARRATWSDSVDSVASSILECCNLLCSVTGLRPGQRRRLLPGAALPRWGRVDDEPWHDNLD